MALVAALGGAELGWSLLPSESDRPPVARQPPATQQKGYESWRVVACGYHHQNTDSSPGNIMGEGQWNIGRGQEEGGAVL